MGSGDEASEAELEDVNEMIMEKQVVIKLPGCKKKWIPEYKENWRQGFYQSVQMGQGHLAVDPWEGHAIW